MRASAATGVKFSGGVPQCRGSSNVGNAAATGSQRVGLGLSFSESCCDKGVCKSKFYILIDSTGERAGRPSRN